MFIYLCIGFKSPVIKEAGKKSPKASNAGNEVNRGFNKLKNRCNEMVLGGTPWENGD